MSHLFSCCTFFTLYLLCTLFMLHFFRVVQFSCCTFLCYTFFMLNSFRVALCSCCTVFMLHVFVCCTAFMLHLCSCCLMLYSVRVALFRHSGQKLYLKETPSQVFSCEICDIFKTTYFEEHLRTTASKTFL